MRHKNLELVEVGLRPLTDNEYLEELILYLYRFKSNQICKIKDTNSACVAVSPVFAKMLGFGNINEMVGKKDEDMPCKVSETADIFYKQDREVENDREKKETLNILEYTTGLEILKCVKKPIINPATNNVLGTYGQSVRFIPDSTLKTIIGIHADSFGEHFSLDVADCSRELDLTKKELEVLFCVCLGLSDRKSIARFLSFIYKKDINADTTVKDAFKKLYSKLPCNSISMLVEYAVTHNLHLRIPKSFLKEGSFEIIQ